MTRLIRHIAAPRSAVYRALIDRDAVARWMVPDDMTSQVHTFDARPGGEFRITLTYAAPAAEGKTTAHSDTYHGRFLSLIPGERVVEVMEFETSDPAMAGEMRVTFTLADSDGGTLLTALHENLPPGISASDNEVGWGMSLDKLSALVMHKSAADGSR